MKHMEVNKKIRIITAVVAFIVALATLTKSSVASPVEQSSSAAKEGAGDSAPGDESSQQEDASQQPGSAQATNQASNDPDDLRDNDRPLTGQDLIDEEFPRSWPLFGSDYRLGFKGYVKLDYLQDFSGTGDRFQFVTATIPVEGTPEAEVGGYMNMFVRETRFSFEVRKTTEGAPPQKFFLEMDFFQESAGAFNQYPRLRHAYFVYGRFLAGRTWGLLTAVQAVPALIDFAAGDALAGTRAAQIRWQQRVSEGFKWTVGIQMQEFPGIENVSNQTGRPSQNLPVFAGRIDREWGASSLMLGGGFTQLRWDGEGVGPNATAYQFGVVFNGRLTFPYGGYVLWNSSFGKGSGNGVIALIGQGASATLTPEGELDTMRAASAAVGYGHPFSKRVSSTVHVAWTELDPSELRAPDRMKASITAHANVLCSITENMSAGVEYMYGRRTNTDDRFGVAHRLQVMTKYAF